MYNEKRLKEFGKYLILHAATVNAGVYSEKYIGGPPLETIKIVTIFSFSL